MKLLEMLRVLFSTQRGGPEVIWKRFECTAHAIKCTKSMVKSTLHCFHIPIQFCDDTLSGSAPTLERTAHT